MVAVNEIDHAHINHSIHCTRTTCTYTYVHALDTI